MTLQSDHETLLSPFERYAHFREHQPVLRDDRLGYYLLFRHADVRRAYEDHAVFSSVDTVQPPPSGLEAGMFLMMDPPDHTRLRRLAQKAFTSGAVAKLESRVAAIVEHHLDRLAEPGADFVAALSGPFPALVIAEMLGVDPDLRSGFIEIAGRIVTTIASPGPAAQEALEALVDFMRGVVEEKRRRPDDGLLSTWLQGEGGDEALTEAELVGFGALMLTAGHETTTNLLTSVVRCLSDAPDAQARLVADPSLAPKVISEVLRCRGPALGSFRRVREDVVLRGVRIPAGSRVLPLILAANRDPEVFTDPERFDPHRSTRGMLPFGAGIHRCLGEPLARLEARVAVELIYRRYPRLRVDPSEPLVPIESPLIHGVRRLPIRVD